MENASPRDVQQESGGTSGVVNTSAEPRRQPPRSPRVVFHVTGFGVFNGIPDNPTTHLVNELRGELRTRRGAHQDDADGRDARPSDCADTGDLLPGEGAVLPAFGGEGEESFEVRSCMVLDVSADIGGRQVRELHAAHSAKSSGGQGRAESAPRGPDGRSAGSDVGDRENDEEAGSPESVRGQSGAPAEGGTTKSHREQHDGHSGMEQDNTVTVFVHCGVNDGSDKFALETQGFNEATFRVPDEQGYTPTCVPVEEGNPDTEHCRVTTVPVSDVLRRLEAMGWGPEHVTESKDAGRFVCNYVYYTSLGLCERSASIEASSSSRTGLDASDFNGSGNTEDGRVGGRDESDCGTPSASSRHSLFIHVPPFSALSKEKQLSLLIACLSAIAAALSRPSSPGHSANHEGDADLSDPPFVAVLSAAVSNDLTPTPPLSLSSYEAAVLAKADQSSPYHSDISGTEDAVQAERARVSIWDRSVNEKESHRITENGDTGGLSERGGSGVDGRQRLVQFALDALADEDDNSDECGGNVVSEDEVTYSRGEIGVDSDSDCVDDKREGENTADATRRKLIAAGFHELDVDAAMATTESDNTDVNMAFLLDVTPLLPRGPPTSTDRLFLREQSTSGDGGAAARDSGGNRGGGAIRPRVRPLASPAAMGGVSPKWKGELSPAGDGTDKGTDSSRSGGGGFFRRLRRGHRRVPSGASLSSEVMANGDGEQPLEPSFLSAPRQRSSTTTSTPDQREYTRRTTGHVGRSHSPPRARGIAGGHVVGDLRGGVGGGVASHRRRGSDPSMLSGASVSAGWGEISPSGPNLTLALLVRLDLRMTPGTVAAQCSRATLAAATKAATGGLSDTLAVWREAGEAIVVLGAADAGRLNAILEVGAACHLPITMVRDKQPAWVGNVGAHNCTVAALGPAPMSALRAVAGSLPVM